jgi:hypothetical protein
MNQTTVPTPDDIAMAGMEAGDASKGDTVVGNGEMECSGCDAVIEIDLPVYWCGDDAFCSACVLRAADSTRLICDALESGELHP